MKTINDIIDKIPSYLKNKYLIAIVLFLIWITFFDNFNLIKQSKIKKNIKQLEENKKFYSEEIKKDSTEYQDLLNNEEKREKFAREKFLMKKDNDVSAIMVPVGLFGLAIKTILVRSLQAAKMASTPVMRRCSGTSTGVAPAASVEMRYIANPCSV